VQQSNAEDTGTGPFNVGGLGGPRPAPLGPHSQSYAGKGFGGGSTNWRRYYNPSNTNGRQFNTEGVRNSLIGIAEGHARSQYFRRAGMGSAVRYTLGLRQLPSHMTDYINRQTHGQADSPLYAHEQEEPWHSPTINPEEPWH
jgi:hypothetical protein